MYSRLADGSAGEERLSNDSDFGFPNAITQDGKALIYTRMNAREESDIMIMALEGDRTPKVLIGGAANEQNATLSPDGKWIAHQSNESGKYQIYVQPYPSLDRRWQVSSEEGYVPRWSARGDAIYYWGGNVTKTVKVSVVTTPEFRVGKRVELNTNKSGYGFLYEMPDGRLLMSKPIDEAATARTS